MSVVFSLAAADLHLAGFKGWAASWAARLRGDILAESGKEEER